MRRTPLTFDPIAEAAKNWRTAGWEDATPGMSLVTSIMRAQQILLGTVDTTLGPFGLTFARFEVLMLLDFSRTGLLPLGKIGQRLQVHPASVTNAIDRLQHDGLVQRIPHPTDGRTTLASITEAGRILVRRAATALNDNAFTHTGLSPKEIDDVVGSLTTLRREANDFTTPPGPDERVPASGTARRALALIDLTELGDSATSDDVAALCTRASTADGTVAAVCVWPRFVPTAKGALAGTGVRIATVVNFPSGNEATADVVDQTIAALADGADEIDVVLPYRSFAAGDVATAIELLDAVRAAVPRDTGALMKVILETGELKDLELIDAAARLAIGHGADFIKTSTGKTPNSATLAATEVMLNAIRSMDRSVGLKPSGGIRSMDDAAAFLAQADAMMGAHWVTPRTFRFGASGLLTALIAAIHETSSHVSTETDY